MADEPNNAAEPEPVDPADNPITDTTATGSAADESAAAGNAGAESDLTASAAAEDQADGGAATATLEAEPPLAGTNAVLTQEELNRVLAEAGLGAADVDTSDDIGDDADAAHAASRSEPSPYVPPAVQNTSGPSTAEEDALGIGLINDVSLDVKVELGRAKMMVEDVLRLGAGSVVELDKLAGDPVDIFVNERLVARGEVLVLNDDFCVRISEIITPTAEFVEG